MITARRAGLTFMIFVGLGGAWLATMELRSQRCDAALEAGRELMANGESDAALMRMDRTDRWCRCEAFTQGDAPPMYSAMVQCIRDMRFEEGDEGLGSLLPRARGPMLQQIARDWRGAVTAPTHL